VKKEQTILKFLENNSTANGRRKGVTHFYDQQFSSFYLPSSKKLIKLTQNEKEKILLFKFNEIQKELKKKTISSGCAKKVKDCFHKFCRIMPHKSDYCNNCSKFYVKKVSLEQQIKLKKNNNVFEEYLTNSHNYKQFWKY
jgi:hypothetical protein